MPDWMTRLREMVWPAVLAVVFTALALGTAFLAPERLSQALSLGLAGVTMALLAIRE